MSLARAARPKSGKRAEAMILFEVASYTFAISASAVDEIRDAAALKVFKPSPRLRVPSVSHTLTRDGKTLFVVSGNFHFRLLPSPVNRVLLLRHSPVGLAVAQTHRMTEVSTMYALPRAFTGEERSWYRGLVLIGEDVVPVVNPASFLDEAQLERLQIEYAASVATKGATA